VGVATPGAEEEAIVLVPLVRGHAVLAVRALAVRALVAVAGGKDRAARIRAAAAAVAKVVALQAGAAPGATSTRREAGRTTAMIGTTGETGIVAGRTAIGVAPAGEAAVGLRSLVVSAAIRSRGVRLFGSC